MVYQKGRVFHSQCYTDHGNDFATPDPELAQLSAKTRVELVQLKNMKIRSEMQKQNSSPVKKVKEKSRKRPKKARRIKSKSKRPKSKAKRAKRKAGKAKKKSGRRR
jgi:hypothetical protein